MKTILEFLVNDNKVKQEPITEFLVNKPIKGEKSEEYKKYKKEKEKFPDNILLFRAGDTYEAYMDDAIECSNILGITLHKDNGINFIGFPSHSLDTYLPKLIRSGKKVAISE